MERLVILSVLILVVSAGPIQHFNIGTTCSKTCTGSDKFNYIPGRTYEFQYDAEIGTSVQGSSEDHAGVHMSATVHMEVHSKCELVMRLTHVSLEEYDPQDVVMKQRNSGTFSNALERYPLRISFQDGNIEDLCLVAEEPDWALNIKRGVLSVFQSNFVNGQQNHTLKETDIAGNCDTSYTTGEDGWYSKTIKKTKNLLSCTERNGYRTSIQGIPYAADSDIQSLPIIKSSHECEHQIDNQLKHLTSATCREQHMFRPFSKGDSGAVTESTQKLKLIQQTPGTRPVDPAMKTVSLKFEHANDVDMETKTRKELEKKLMEICESTEKGVNSDTPRLFSGLVYIVRATDSSTLLDTYRRIQEGGVCSANKERVSKFLLDALPVAGTSGALHMMIELLTRKVVTGLEGSMWLTSLSFIKNPTQDMLAQVKPLINLVDYEEKAMLSIGTMIHSYCSNNGGCSSDRVVKAIVSAMENKMARGCKVRDANFKTTLIALRAIGNAGYANSALPTLKACMRIKTNPTEIRLSAIEAFRRMPCDADQDEILPMFLNKDEDSEIRIAAYKTLMECPTEGLINIIKRTLEKEEVNQVGSYVWSHLTNLMETSDRHKQFIRDILEDAELKKEFDLDKRKFSRNYEGSVFIEKLNTGAKLEGDLIWSSKSFIPRSAMVNLTVDLFGHSVNLFELGGRVEGLEYFMESFFGPNGYFSENTPEKPVDVSNAKSLHPMKMKKIDSRFNQKLDELRAAMYLRVFGNELRYMNFHGLESLLSGPNINILEMLIQLSKDNDYTFTHSTMFLDSSMIIPTGAGFPMNLTVNGMATMDLKLKGKMDLRSPPNVDIEGLIQPSAAIDVSSIMSVDSYVTKSGIKMVSTLHTNTMFLGKLKMGQGGVISAEYEMPEPRMDIISVKSSFFTIHNNLEKEQKMVTENQQTKRLCSSDKLVTITGLELCGELQYPNASMKSDAPYFPMTGPVTAGVYLYNRDTHRKYKMETRFLHSSKSDIVHFSFDTPESKIDRHVAVDINLNKKDYTLDMTLTSPWNKANFQGVVTNERALKGVSGKMNLGGQYSYAVDALMKRERVGNAHKYSPSLEIKLPNKEPVTVSGMFMYNGNRQFDVKFNMDKIMEKPLEASGTIYNRPNLQGLTGKLVLGDKQEYSIDVSNTKKLDKKKVSFKPLISLRSPTSEVLAFGGDVQYVYGKKLDYSLVLDKIVMKKITLKGFLQKIVKRRNRVLTRTKVNIGSGPMDVALDAKIDNRNFRTIASDIQFAYVIRRVARNNIKLVSKFINLSSSSLLKGKSTMNLEVKRNPELNMKLVGNINHNADHTEADLDVRYGDNFKDENKRVEMSISSDRKFNSILDVSADGQLRFRHMGQGLNMMLKGSHKHDNRDLNSNIFMKFGRREPIESTLRFSDRTADLLNMAGVFTLNYPGRQIVINETLEQTEPNTYVSTFSGQLQKGRKTSVITSFTQNSPDNGRFVTDVHFNKQTPYHVDTEWSLDPTQFFTRASYQKDATRYAGSITSVTVGHLSKLITDIELPERHIKLALEGRPDPKLWSGIAELKYNAGRDDTERLSVSGWLEPVSDRRLNGSISLYYPRRTLTLNAHHIVGAKYTSHADFAWEKKKKVDVDFIFGMANRKGTKKMVSKAKIRTPFDGIRSVAVDVTHADVADEYKTDVDLKWAQNTISTTTIIRKPLSFRTIVGSIEAATSFKVVKKMRLDVNHKLSDSLASAAKFSWNKKFVQAEVILMNQTKGNKVSFKGDIDMKSSFAVMKKGTISLSHKNDGITFTTDGNFLRNRKKYGFSSKVTHQSNELGLDHSGSLTLLCPHGNSETRWSHRNTQSNIASYVSTKWGNKLSKEIELRINGNEDVDEKGTIEASIDLQTPFNAIRDMRVQFNHEHKSAYLDSSFKILKDKKSIALVEAIYKPDFRVLDSHFIVTIPDLDVDSSITITGKDKSSGASISFDVVITPELSLSITANAMLDDSLHSAVEFKSSFPGYEQITYTYDAEMDKFNGEHQLSIVRQLHYGNGKMIEIATKLSLSGKHKRGFMVITTPYDSMKKWEGNIHCETAGYNTWPIKCDSYIEVLPLFERISTSVEWNTSEGLIGSLHVETPYPVLSDLKASVIVKGADKLMETKVGLDYNLEQLLHADIRIGITDENMYDISVKVSQPLSVILTHMGSLEKFKSKAELGLESGRKVYGIDADFTTHNKIEGSLTLSSPARRDITASFSHSGNMNSFTTHAEIMHNRKNQFTSDFSFNSLTNSPLSVSGSASLKTELLANEEFGMEFHHSGSSRNFLTHAELSSIGLGKSEADLSFSMHNDIDSSFSLKSPLMENQAGSFNMHRNSGYLQVRTDYYNGQSKVFDFQGTLNTRDSFIGEISLTNPLTDQLTAEVRANGDVEDLVVHAKGSYGTKKSDLELTSRIQRDYIQETFTIKATGMPDITAEISHNGQLESFKSFAQISIGQEKHRVDASFSSLFDIEGTLSIVSPTVSPVSSRFSFQGIKTNFQSHAEFVIGSDKSEVDTSFSMSPKLQASLKLQTPYWMDVASELEHSGTFPNILSQVKVGYNGKQQYSGTVSLSSIDKLAGSISVDTPFEDLQNLNLAISHEGHLNNFKCHGEVALNGDKTEGDIIYSSVGRYEGLMTLKSHLFQDISAGFEHSGSFKSFKSHAEYSYGLAKTEGDISVEISDEIDINLRLRAPYDDEIQISYLHKGTKEDFSCKADYIYGTLKHDINLRFKNKDKMQVNFEMKPALWTDQDFEVIFEHGMRPGNNYKTHGEISIGNTKNTADIELNIVDIPMINIAVSSPEISLNLQHSGLINSFKTHGDLTYNGEKREADVIFMIKEDINASVTIIEPMFSLKINHNGDLGNFLSNIELVNAYDRYSYDTHLMTKNGVDASITISSPIEGYESLKALYTHEGKINNFKCHGEISMPDSISTGDLKLNIDTALEGSLSLSSPVIPDINAEFDHSTTKTYYKSHAEFSVDHDVITGMTLTLDYNSGLDGDLHLMTPFIGYRDLRSSLRFKGDERSFTVHDEVLIGTQRHAIDISYDAKPKHSGTVSIRTPMLPELDADFSLMGTLSKFDVDTKFLVNGLKTMSVLGSMNIEDAMTVNFDIVTPVENYTRISGQFSQSGDLNNLNNDAEFSIEGRMIIKSNGQFKYSEKIMGSASLESVFFDPVKASFEFQEERPNGFKSHGELSLDKDTWAADIAIALDDNLDTSFSLSLPNHDMISGSLKHDTKYKRCTTLAKFELDSDNKYQYESTMDWRRSLGATFSLKTPLEGYEDNSLTLSHEGDFPNIRSSAKLSYPNSELSMSGSLNYADSTTGKLTLVIPVEGYENIDISFFHEGHYPNYKAGANIVYTTGKQIETSIEHKQLGNMEFFKLHLMSPFTDEMDFTFNHTGVPSDFVNSFGIAIGQDIRFNIENSLKTGHEYFSYTSSATALLSGERYSEKFSVSHQGNLQKFKTDASLSVMEKFVHMETLFQLDPNTEATVFLQSSYEPFKDVKAGFSNSKNPNGFLTTGELQLSPTDRIEGKIDYINHGWRRMVTNVEIRTPFTGYTMNKISYQHTGDSDSFQCDGEMVVGEKTLTGTISASASPMNIDITIHTPIQDYERLVFTGNVDSDSRRGRYSSRLEASWNPSKRIVFDGSFSALHNYRLLEGTMTLSSPFEQLKRLSIDLNHRELADKYMESLKANFNGESLVDVELDHSLLSAHKTATLVFRAPRPMSFEVNGDLAIDNVDVELNANWNVGAPSSSIHANAGYDFRSSEKTANFKLTSIDQVISYSGSIDDTQSKSHLSWGARPDQKIGYEITYDSSNARAKVVLPSRSLQVTGSTRGRITEGSFMWDADVDLTKKIGFRTFIAPTADSVKVDLTLILPSLGKNVQLGSEMVVNRGRIIFDAKTELSYSDDDRKKLVIISKLEDISRGSSSKNYSFSLGLSHPFSTIGIKMASHVGQSRTDLTGSIGLEYLTYRRQTKAFQMSGQIDKLRKTVNFEMQSPVKTISISGSAQTSDAFRISLLNVYDERRPLSTVFTVDRQKRNINFVMNYDLDSPNSELHVSAGYVNSSAVAAEIFRVTNGIRETDALVALRLNNSRLLHSRLHWRPNMIQDLKITFRVPNSLDPDQAQHFVGPDLSPDCKGYQQITLSHMDRKSANYKQRLSHMMETLKLDMEAELIEKVPLIVKSVEEVIGEAAVKKIDEFLIQVILSKLEGVRGVSADFGAILAENVRQLTNRTSISYQGIGETILKARNSLPSWDSLDFTALSMTHQPLSVPASYVIDMYHDQLKHLPSGLSGSLKYGVDTVLPEVMSQQVTNANSYWDWEENVEDMFESVLLWLERELLETLETIERELPKPGFAQVTVYDPAHGEVQVEFHLPVPLKSLDSLPVVNLSLPKYLGDAYSLVSQVGPLNGYIPDLGGEWMPPFSAHAYIQNGHKFTTFDGYDYDLPLDCTFILAKDFMDGNFSLILSNDGGTSLTVLSKGKQLNIKLSGEVSVDGKSVELPYQHKNLTVTSPVDGQITVDGAGSFKISWDTVEDYITVTISGWYYGKTGGLLGVYDNEPSNDFTTPYKKIVDNPKRFASTWDIGRTACR